MRTVLIRAAIAAITLSAIAAQAAPAMTGQTAKGPALVDAKSMTLYTFDKDMGGKSMCNGPCAANWPALAATAGSPPAADWTMITRDDGTMQWAYKGRPLYTFAKDTKPGETMGDGFLNGAWHIAQP